MRPYKCDCPDCVKGNVRHDTKITITNVELDSIQIIMNHINCAEQAVSPSAIPDGISKEKAAAFITGAIQAKAEAQFLHDAWWRDLKRKYDLDPVVNYRIDFATGEIFYYAPEA